MPDLVNCGAGYCFILPFPVNCIDPWAADTTRIHSEANHSHFMPCEFHFMPEPTNLIL